MSSKPKTNKNLELLVKQLDKKIEEVDKKIGYAERALRVEIKFSTLTIGQEMDSNLKKLKDFLLTTFDPLLKELEDRRQDREISSSQTSAIRETVEDHETRITKLETL